jgi:hypothetical protein
MGVIDTSWVRHLLLTFSTEALVYSAIAISMWKEHFQLIEETKAILEKVKTERKQIFEEFEEFLKQNSFGL